MSKTVPYWLYKLIIFAVIIFACNSRSDRNTIWNQLFNSKWVSSKLFEAPDYRDYITFENKTEFLFFDAASSTFYNGSYEIENDTLNLNFVEDELHDLKRYRLIFKVEYLQFFESEFKNGEKYQNPNSRLKYKRAPI